MDDKFVKVQLANGAICHVQVSNTNSEELVGLEDVKYKLDQVKDQITGVVSEISSALEKIAPDKTSIEFGIELGIESNAIVAFFVKGTAKTNFKITLEWENKKK